MSAVASGRLVSLPARPDAVHIADGVVLVDAVAAGDRRARALYAVAAHVRRHGRRVHLDGLCAQRDVPQATGPGDSARGLVRLWCVRRCLVGYVDSCHFSDLSLSF